MSILPQKHHKRDSFLGYRRTLYETVKTKHSLGTRVPMSYYTNHMTDPDYIHRIHAKVNGKLNKWRELTLEISDKLKATKLFREDYLLAQKKWA